MICRRRRFIFIHTPRTGGQSIEHVLFPGYTFSDREDREHLHGWHVSLGWLNHLTAEETIARGGVDSELAGAFCMFAFVRNPWERLVSEYCWKFPDAEVSFRDFIFAVADGGNPRVVTRYRSRRAYEQHVRPQSEYLFCASGNLMVDELGRYERVEEDFRRICSQIGVGKVSLPYMNASRHAPYPDYYDAETRRVASRLYAEDLDNFAYVFDGIRCERS